jgi:hypothetical protein
MPFGLDIKSMIVGALIAYFLVPMLMGMINRPTAARAAA